MKMIVMPLYYIFRIIVLSYFENSIEMSPDLLLKSLIEYHTFFSKSVNPRRIGFAY